jgi:hypothetical protein
MRLDPNHLHYSLYEAGLLLAKLGRAEVEPCLDGLRQYGEAFYEAYDVRAFLLQSERASAFTTSEAATDALSSLLFLARRGDHSDLQQRQIDAHRIDSRRQVDRCGERRQRVPLGSSGLQACCKSWAFFSAEEDSDDSRHATCAYDAVIPFSSTPNPLQSTGNRRKTAFPSISYPCVLCIPHTHRTRSITLSSSIPLSATRLMTATLPPCISLPIVSFRCISSRYPTLPPTRRLLPLLTLPKHLSKNESSEVALFALSQSFQLHLVIVVLEDVHA